LQQQPRARVILRPPATVQESHERGGEPDLPLRPRTRQTGSDALHTPITLELGNRAEQVQLQASGGSRGVDAFPFTECCRAGT
jgi:hypothetical protein